MLQRLTGKSFNKIDSMRSSRTSSVSSVGKDESRVPRRLPQEQKGTATFFKDSSKNSYSSNESFDLSSQVQSMRGCMSSMQAKIDNHLAKHTQNPRTPSIRALR